VPFAIAQVTPYAWEAGHAVNVHVDALARALHARGHRVLVLAPSRDAERVRESRALIRAAREAPDALFAADGPRVLAVGEVLPDLPAARRAPALPIDVARTIEELLAFAPLDLVHVHEPFAPSTASVALRHSRALNIGTFHAPTERLVSTQVARKVVEVVFGRLDARVASSAATAELLGRFFPAEYRVVLPAVLPPGAADGDGTRAPGRVVFVDLEERGALRAFLRAARRRDGAAADVVVATDRPPAAPPPGVRFAPLAAAADELAAAEVVVTASDGALPAPDVVLRALAAGAVPLASRLPVYEELLGDGERGLLFEPGDVVTLGAQLDRLLGDAGLRGRLRGGADALRPLLDPDRVADAHEALYDQVAARRHPLDGPRLPASPARRRIDVDLHMHTDHSGDCATPVEVLLDAAREQGLGAIATTHHNDTSGALEGRRKAAEYGVQVIVGEEVKTAGQGEVIGLFLEEKIPRGMTLRETVDAIKAQGGVVYVPHPFDRMHSVPDYAHLLTILEDIDAIEIYNPRVAIGSFNEEAERFAAKYRILAAAGSDAHVAQGLGSVRVRMPGFDGPQEFRAALREAEVITKPSSLLYVQALKFLETKATPPAARRAVRDRRVRRATRKA